MIEDVVQAVGSFAGGLAIAGVVAVLILGLTIQAVIFVVKNGVIGAIILWIASFVGSMFGLYIPITFWSALITGILGVPGALAVIAYYNLF